MKNIHTLFTTGPSRLKSEYGTVGSTGCKKFVLSREPLHWRFACYVYVTSDEDIEEGNWVYYENGDLKGIHKVVNGKRPKTMILKKIILTNDPQLITDGVQEVDEEFLEWFVKNPDAEIIKVAHTEIWRVYELGGDVLIKQYRTVIPQEVIEPEPVVKDLAYWKNNCEENYMTTPISVLRYISELEKALNITDDE